MADKISTVTEFKIGMTLTRPDDGDQVTRNLTFPTVNEQTTVDFWKQELRPALLGKYKWIIQPASWRDDDDTEAAYECTEAEGKIVTTQTLTLDPTA